jgi:hypothetical protein
MDREIRHELDRLFSCYQDALAEIRSARSDDELLTGWRKVQTAGWELNAVLPTADYHSLA